jgi:tight adherence protein C
MLSTPSIQFIAISAAGTVVIIVLLLLGSSRELLRAWRRGQSIALVARPALPRWLRLWLPIARVLAVHAGPCLPVVVRARCQTILRQAGLDEELLPQEWLMLSLVWSVLGGLVPLILGRFGIFGWLSAIVVMSLPWLWLRDTRRRREHEILRDLPMYLDMLTLALEAGGALSVALRVATDRAVESPLKQALLRVQGDLRAGRSRAEALRALGERLDIASMTPLIAALIQADASGGSLAAVLRAQSEQRLNERYALAEKLAMEAPVKMLLPLVLCIFPCTVVVLAFPIVLRFLSAFQ